MDFSSFGFSLSPGSASFLGSYRPLPRREEVKVLDGRNRLACPKVNACGERR